MGETVSYSVEIQFAGNPDWFAYHSNIADGTLACGIANDAAKRNPEDTFRVIADRRTLAVTHVVNAADFPPAEENPS
jgi:hypothetical protein